MVRLRELREQYQAEETPTQPCLRHRCSRGRAVAAGSSRKPQGNPYPFGVSFRPQPLNSMRGLLPPAPPSYPHAAVPSAPQLTGESGSGRGQREIPREPLPLWGFLLPSAAEKYAGAHAARTPLYAHGRKDLECLRRWRVPGWGSPVFWDDAALPPTAPAVHHSRTPLRWCGKLLLSSEIPTPPPLPPSAALAPIRQF